MGYFNADKASQEGSLEDSQKIERQMTGATFSSVLGIGDRTPFVGQPSAHLPWQKRHWDAKLNKTMGVRLPRCPILMVGDLMGFFSAPSVPPPKPEPTVDPNIKAQQDAIRGETEAAARETGDAAKRRYQGRTMGTEGSNAYFTGGPAGYGRTMGQANI